jgi:predicted nucleic acid-binding protein
MKTLGRVDTKVLLRHLLNDDPNQSPKARALIRAAHGGQYSLDVTAVTIAEIFYALRLKSSLGRPRIAEILMTLLSDEAFGLDDEERIFDALERVKARNVDFADAHIVASCVLEDRLAFSFDKDFARFADVKKGKL